MRYQMRGSLMLGLPFADLDPLGTFRHLEKLDSKARNSSFLNPQPARNQVRNIQFAVIHEGTPVIDSYELAHLILGVVHANQGAKRESGAGSGRRIHVKPLTTSRLSALKPGPIPACPAGPNSNGLNRLAGMCHQGSFQALCHKKHEWEPAERGPNHEQSPTHWIHLRMNYPL